MMKPSELQLILHQHSAMLIMLYITQKMKFSIKNCFSKCDRIRSYQRIWSHLLKKSLMENFIFCAVIISDLLAFLVMMLFSSFCCFSVSEQDTSRKLHDYEDIHEEFFLISLKNLW